MPKFALLLLVGLFVQIQVFSQEDIQDSVQDPAQNAVQDTVQNPVQNPVNEETVIVEDPHKTAEQALTFGNGSVLPVQKSGASVWAIIRMILVLALAAAAIYGIVYFIKRSSKQTSANDPFLKILASSHLGFNRYVHIASVGSKAWLLGASEGGVSLISEIEDKEIIDAMLLEDSKKSVETQSRFPDFLSILRRLGTPGQTSSSDGVDEIRKRRERLKGL